MHHALEIQEILSNIFGHCHWADLASLARTCRAFKDPALHVLWEELHDLLPLAQCLPEVFHQVPGGKYSLSRPPEQTEWETLRSYTRRIRSIQSFSGEGLNYESLGVLFNPPTFEPLLPNLISLIFIRNPNMWRNSLKWLPKCTPNVRGLTLGEDEFYVPFGEFASKCICRWRSLQTVICPRIALSMEALVHLSRLPAFTRLEFLLSTPLPASDSPFSFSDLHDLTLHSDPWDPISRLLSQTRLPVLTDLMVIVDSCPSREELSSFWASVQTSSAGHTIERLWLKQSPSFRSNVRSEALLLGLEDLRPCMAFSNVRCLRLNIPWKVSLTDRGLLALAPAWPNLEELFINGELGWNMQGGITPNGLLQLLRKCRSLRNIALAVDTRGYTELPPSGLLASLGLTLPPEFYVDVLDSVIEEESVPAVAAFFTAIALCSDFSIYAWSDSGRLVKPQGWKEYKARWQDVYRRIKEAVSQRL